MTMPMLILSPCRQPEPDGQSKAGEGGRGVTEGQT